MDSAWYCILLFLAQENEGIIKIKAIAIYTMGIKIITNDKGFIETGRDLQHYEDYKKIWKLERDPYLLETSCAGIFAAGDVRAGAMNRVASAVGEGSMAISFVHKYLGEM